MVTKLKFKDKKQNRTTWVNGKPVRFKNGVATIENDDDAKKLAEKEGYAIVEVIKENKSSGNKSNLETLNGVGKATATKLEKAGFTFENISEAGFDDLLKADIDNATATKIRDNFKNDDDETGGDDSSEKK